MEYNICIRFPWRRLSTFFKEEKNEKIVFDKNDFFIDQQDGYVISRIVPNALKNQMEPIIIDLQPGKRSELMGPHEGEEFGLVLSGKVELVSADGRFTVKKGCTFYTSGEKEHYLLNSSNKNTQVLWVVTPPLF